MNNEALTEIESAEVTDNQLVHLEKLINKFTYTATMLNALSIWLAETGDTKGSDMVLVFAGEFAKHEAETV